MVRQPVCCTLYLRFAWDPRSVCTVSAYIFLPQGRDGARLRHPRESKPWKENQAAQQHDLLGHRDACDLVATERLQLSQSTIDGRQAKHRHECEISRRNWKFASHRAFR